ncbi:MAG: DNA cytosine methyltransferase [Candidatus Omnitrophica bacterium]|nr:DNA cytosine methyltransferase [Candidatus Omnitrophota bacterium]
MSQAKMAGLMGLQQYILSQWELGTKTPTKAEGENIKNFFSKFDVEYKKGKISFKKRYVKHQYKLSAQTSNGRNGRRKEAEARDHKDGVGEIAGDLFPKERAVIALFSGIGGLALGFKQAGFSILGFAEKEKSARDMFKANFPEAINLGNDVKDITNDKLLHWHEQIKALDGIVGGPPCQGFSLAGKRDVYDPRNQLYNEFARISSILKPKFVVLENVRTLLSMMTPSGGFVKDDMVEKFDKAGYKCLYQEINAQNYGVPQSRERVLFVGIRKDINIVPAFPVPTHGKNQNMLPGIGLKPYKTFRDATKDLECLESGEESKNDRWHFAIAHPDHVIKWLKNVPEGMSAHDNTNPALRPPSGYNTTYKRIKWNEPCSTIGTNFSMISGCRNVHPSSTRSLTIREAARCQTFPDNFIFLGNYGDVRKGIGNAVPPLLAKTIAEYLLKKFY